jgi:hypothetical protein
MGRDDLGLVRHQSIPNVSDGNGERPIVNKFASLVATDLFTQLLLSGFCFHMQTGTEDAPSTSNTTIDDVKAVMIADITSGAGMPLFADTTVATWAAATTVHAMLEADMDKARYTSGGTVYVPEQMNKAATGAAAANGTFYTIEGSDIVAAAKSAVPASVELARIAYTEDAQPATTFAGAQPQPLFSASRQVPVILTNPGSLLVHFGASADLTFYASLDFAQFPVALAW